MKKDINTELLVAVREFVSYGMCRQANADERKMLAGRFAELSKKYEPLLARLGVSPREMAQVEFDEKYGVSK